MLLYEDIINGSEMFTDAYDVKLIDNIVYEVDCQMITVKAGVDVDIGANPSAEEEAEALEEGAERVNNIIHSFRLQPITPRLSKNDYKSHMPKYMKLLSRRYVERFGANHDEVTSFKKNAAAYFKKILENFDSYDCYTNEDYPIEAKDEPVAGMVALLNYREDGITPYFTFWKDGLKEVKI